MATMFRGYVVFGDIEGKLDVLRVDRTRCGRGGRYSVAKLIEKHGRKGNLMVWREMLNGDVPSGTPGYTIGAISSVSICRKCREPCVTPDTPKQFFGRR
jgi:hypothetical protein